MLYYYTTGHGGPPACPPGPLRGPRGPRAARPIRPPCVQVGVYGTDADVMKTSDWWRSLAYAVLGRVPTRSEDRRRLDALNACAARALRSTLLAPPRWRGRRGRTLWAASPAAARPRASLARAGTAEGVATLLLARVFMHVRHEGGLPQVPAGGVIVDSAAPAVAQAPRSVAQVPRRPQGNGCPNPTRPQGGRDHGRRAAVL